LWLFGDGKYDEYFGYKPFIEHQYDDPGYFNVKLYTTASISGITVQDSMVKQILVHPAPEAAFATNALCQQAPINFTDLSSILYDTITRWKWNFGDGSFDTLQHPVHRYNYDTDFDVELISFSNMGCSDTVSQHLLLNPSPVLNLVPDNQLFCVDDEELEFSDTSGVAYTDYYWDWGDADTTISHQPTAWHRYVSGTYTAQLKVYSDLGCPGNDSVNFVVRQKPWADFTVSPHDSLSVLEGEFLFSNQSSAPESTIQQWQWFFGDGDDTLCESLLHKYDSAGVFEVRLVTTDEFGCTDTALKTVKVYPERVIFAPNAFTPNWDGINNIFMPKISYIDVDHYLLQIYSRWGDKMFETTNPAIGWDGTYKGEKVSPGVYSWYVELSQLNGKPETFQGSVMLIR
jgi:gliding motility-associated-like protein